MSDAVPRRPDGRPLWYGRRQGHKLRPNRQKLFDELLPQIRIGADGAGPIDLDAAFGRACAGYRLEIGFGSGEHLAGEAAKHPDIGFVGSEPFVNGVAALLGEIDARGLTNIRLFDDDVRLLLDRLPPAAFERAEVLFADPWPKTRHHRRRIIQTSTLDTLAKLVRPGGTLVFATDHMGYASYALERLCRHPLWKWMAKGPRDWRVPPEGWIPTRYEAKAKRKGDAPVYLLFERIS